MKIYFVCPSKTSNTKTTFSFLIKLCLSADSFFLLFLFLFSHQSLIPLLPPVVMSLHNSLTKRRVCVGRASCLCRRTDNVMSVVIGKTMSNCAATRRRTDPDCEAIRRKEKDELGEVDIYLGCLSATARPRV